MSDEDLKKLIEDMLRHYRNTQNSFDPGVYPPSAHETVKKVLEICFVMALLPPDKRPFKRYATLLRAADGR